jgi:hypothetical protein
MLSSRHWDALQILAKKSGRQSTSEADRSWEVMR